MGPPRSLAQVVATCPIPRPLASPPDQWPTAGCRSSSPRPISSVAQVGPTRTWGLAGLHPPHRPDHPAPSSSRSRARHCRREGLWRFPIYAATNRHSSSVRWHPMHTASLVFSSTELLDAAINADWDAVDGELRQFVIRLGGLAGSADGPPSQLVWLAWVGAAGALLVARRASHRGRALFPRSVTASSPAPGDRPLPVGPWPLGLP